MLTPFERDSEIPDFRAWNESAQTGDEACKFAACILGDHPPGSELLIRWND
jgi:hypothetical protein